MAVVKSDIPRLLQAGLKAIFFDAYTAAPANWEQIATVVPSEKDTEPYAWLGSVPKMREFIDERLPAGLLEHDYSIKNKTWEASIAVDRAALEDDLYGQIKLRVQSLGEETKRHQDELVFSLLLAGFAGTLGTCYDGQYFFDADHSEGDSGTQANAGSSSLDIDSFKATWIAMTQFKDDKGKPMGIIPDTIVVAPNLIWVAEELVGSPAGKDWFNQKNVAQGKVTIVVSPYLANSSYTNSWALLCTKRVVRPVLFQSRIPVEFTALEGNSDSGFMRDEWFYGVRARYNVGFGLWQMAYGHRVA